MVIQVLSDQSENQVEITCQANVLDDSDISVWIKSALSFAIINLFDVVKSALSIFNSTDPIDQWLFFFIRSCKIRLGTISGFIETESDIGQVAFIAGINVIQGSTR